MRFALTDTIAAIATPAGTSALAVIRVSGANAIPLVSTVFSQKGKLQNAEGYQAVHGYIVDDEEVLDEVICLVYRHPHSYTGEDMVEISCHGNPDLTNRILQLLLKACRAAEPGEFTFRAFMNNKLDLAQAEAVNDLIHAQTSKAELSALNQLKGNLSKEISGLIDELTDCRIRFELSIDFADQDLPELDLKSVQFKMQQLRQRLQEIHHNGSQGKILRDGFSICLSGAPNVGKSSLFNRFLQENRAIVTPIPGTTRDYLEEWLSLEGYPVRLLDTAGLRDSSDPVEKIGIGRTRELMQAADLIIMITDPDTLDIECCHPDRLYADKTICILNKIDLLGFEALPDASDWQEYLQGSRFAAKIPHSINLIPCSAILPEGSSELKKQILKSISLPDLQPASILVTNTRHLSAIQRSLASLDKALDSIESAAGYEFIAFDLIESVSALSEITGAVTTDDMLERIFSSFCIGK